MMEQTRIYAALKGVRGRKAVDLAALEQLVVRFSRLVVEQPWIREIDINPLLASPEGLLALDARVIAHASEPGTGGWPRPAIRPYPTQYVAPWTARSGTTLLVRPIRPEDEPLLVQFHQSLSARSVSLRYFHAFKLGQRVAHDRLTRICFIDYDREMVLVAEGKDPVTGGRRSSGSAAWGSSMASTRLSLPSSSSTASRAWDSAPSYSAASSRSAATRRSSASRRTSSPRTTRCNTSARSLVSA